jgi:hypothetical protein
MAGDGNENTNMREKRRFKWVMNAEGKIPIIVSAEVNLSGNL